MKPGSPSRMPTRVLVALLGAALALAALGLPWMGSRIEGIAPLMGYEDSVPYVALRVLAALAAVVLALQLVKVPDLRETQRIVFGGAAVIFVLRPITLVVTNPTTSELSTGAVKLDPVFSPSWGIVASFIAAGLMAAAAVMTHRSDDIRDAAEREAARAALLQDPELAAFAGPPPAPLITPEPDVQPAPDAVDAESETVAYAVLAPVEPEPAASAAPVSLEPAAHVAPEPSFQPTTQTSPQPAPLQEIAPAASSQQHPRAPMHDHSPYRPAASAPPANAHVPMPVTMDDTGPYGPDGPSRLGDTVRVEDALAPKVATPAPHLALMQQPPAHGALAPLPAPAQHQPLAPHSAPAPHQLLATHPAPAQPTPVATPSAAAEPRQRSVAPPGFG